MAVEDGKIQLSAGVEKPVCRFNRCGHSGSAKCLAREVLGEISTVGNIEVEPFPVNM